MGLEMREFRVQFPPKVLYELSRCTSDVRHQRIPGTLHNWKEIIPRCSADFIGKAESRLERLGTEMHLAIERSKRRAHL